MAIARRLLVLAGALVIVSCGSGAGETGSNAAASVDRQAFQTRVVEREKLTPQQAGLSLIHI